MCFFWTSSNKILGGFPCRPFIHRLLVGIRTNVDGRWWGGVPLYQLTLPISSVYYVYVSS